MTTHVILWHIHVTSLTTFLSTVHLLFEIMFIMMSMSSFLKGYMILNLTLVVISYEIYETRQRLVSCISHEMTTRVKSFLYIYIGCGSLSKWCKFCGEGRTKIICLSDEIPLLNVMNC